MTDNMLGDRYILGPLLGRGGMAEVRRGRDIRLERDVAIKRLRPDLAGDAVFQARFRREAQAAAGLNHPNIVSVYDTGEQFDPAAGVDIPYIVMELVVGHTLRDILRDGRKIQPERALELTTSVLNALDYSHRHGIVHRDIKPANVMVTAAGQVKVMDFGIARAVSDTAASMTQTAAVIGTPQYLSPEQIRGETVDRRADIYATGCLLYELLAGRPPFQGDEPVSLAYQHVREIPVPPSRLDPIVSPDMDAIVLKALEKDPANRYQTAKEMADDITRLLTGQQVTAVLPLPVMSGVGGGGIPAEPTQVLTNPDGPTTIGSRGIPIDDYEEPARGRKTLIILIVTLSVILLGVIVGLIIYMNREEPPPEVVTVQVPYVRSMTQETAEEAIRALGLEVEVVHENGENDDTVGQVVRQEPAARLEVEEGSTVTIWINDGPKRGTIPAGLIGMTREDAERALLDAGFTRFNIDPAPLETYPYQSTYVVDHIINCNPAPGSATTVDTVIQLYYDSGEGIVPNIMDYDQAAALRELTKAGFDNVVIEYQESDKPQNSVVAMDPAPSTRTARTSTITIWLAKPPEPEPTPSPTPTATPT
jgi:serine/threonine-protein kinase